MRTTTDGEVFPRLGGSSNGAKPARGGFGQGGAARMAQPGRWVRAAKDAPPAESPGAALPSDRRAGAGLFSQAEANRGSSKVRRVDTCRRVPYHDKRFRVRREPLAPVAQLDRATAYGNNLQQKTQEKPGFSHFR
jgi:hypothetical protein